MNKNNMLYYDRTISMTFLKELVLVEQVHQKTVIFVTIGVFRQMV